MIIRAESTPTFHIDACHGGVGAVGCREVLSDYDQEAPAFKYVHENVLEQGVSIGEHAHSGDKEIYRVGSGPMPLLAVATHLGSSKISASTAAPS